MMKLTKFIIMASISIATGCTPVAARNQTATLAVNETSPVVTPTASVKQSPNVSVQCLEIQPATSTKIESAGNILLQDYYNKRSLFAMRLSNGNSNPTIFGEGFLAPVISPNGKLLAYLNNYDKDTPKIILANSNNEIQRTNPLQWEFVWEPRLDWINDSQLVINSYSHEQMIIFNPFTNDVKDITFDQFPEFNFILNSPWADYDPTLSLVIYPKGGSSALFDVESKRVLAEIPTGVQRESSDASWMIDGNFAAVIGSIFPLTDNMGDELFVVSRSGVVEQLTRFADLYGKGLSLSSPRWSPDGKHIALWEMDRLDNFKDRKLITVDLSTRQVAIYCFSGYPNQYGDYGEYLPAPIWSPDSTQILVENRYSKDHSKVFLIDIPKNIAIQIAQDARPIGWMVSP